MDTGLANPRDLPVQGPQARGQVWLLQTCASRVTRACSRGFCAGMHLALRVSQARVWRDQPAGLSLTNDPGQAAGCDRKAPVDFFLRFASPLALPPPPPPPFITRVCSRTHKATRLCTLWAPLQLTSLVSVTMHPRRTSDQEIHPSPGPYELTSLAPACYCTVSCVREFYLGFSDPVNTIVQSV